MKNIIIILAFVSLFTVETFAQCSGSSCKNNSDVLEKGIAETKSFFGKLNNYVTFDAFVGVYPGFNSSITEYELPQVFDGRLFTSCDKSSSVFSIGVNLRSKKSYDLFEYDGIQFKATPAGGISTSGLRLSSDIRGEKLFGETKVSAVAQLGYIGGLTIAVMLFGEQSLLDNIFAEAGLGFEAFSQNYFGRIGLRYQNDNFIVRTGYIIDALSTSQISIGAGYQINKIWSVNAGFTSYSGTVWDCANRKPKSAPTSTISVGISYNL